MAVTSGTPSLMDNVEFFNELERLEPREAVAPGAQGREGTDEPAADRQPWEHRLHDRGVFIDPPAPTRTAPTHASVGVSVFVLLMGIVAGAGAAALLFHDRLARLLR